MQTDEYDPATGIELDFGFTGKFTDELTGLTHHQNRWFDPLIGKWISEDPIGFVGGDSNTTRYVSNNPLMYTDPTGLFASSSNFANLNEGGGDTGGGDGVRAYIPLEDEDPKIRFFVVFAPPPVYVIPISIPQKDWEHIIQRHGPTSDAGGAGKFVEGTTDELVLNLIATGTSSGEGRPNTHGRPGTIIEHDFGRPIGTNISGEPATRIRVVLRPNLTVQTAFPY